jgi:hypothetical protein
MYMNTQDVLDISQMEQLRVRPVVERDRECVRGNVARRTLATPNLRSEVATPRRVGVQHKRQAFLQHLRAQPDDLFDGIDGAVLSRAC